jgi:hypothetical protein
MSVHYKSVICVKLTSHFEVLWYHEVSVVPRSHVVPRTLLKCDENLNQIFFISKTIAIQQNNNFEKKINICRDRAQTTKVSLRLISLTSVFTTIHRYFCCLDSISANIKYFLEIIFLLDNYGLENDEYLVKVFITLGYCPWYHTEIVVPH